MFSFEQTRKAKVQDQPVLRFGSMGLERSSLARLVPGKQVLDRLALRGLALRGLALRGLDDALLLDTEVVS